MSEIAFTSTTLVKMAVGDLGRSFLASSRSYFKPCFCVLSIGFSPELEAADEFEQLVSQESIPYHFDRQVQPTQMTVKPRVGAQHV
jgi:hypothetical protein